MKEIAREPSSMTKERFDQLVVELYPRVNESGGTTTVCSTLPLRFETLPDPPRRSTTDPPLM